MQLIVCKISYKIMHLSRLCTWKVTLSHLPNAEQISLCALYTYYLRKNLTITYALHLAG